MPALWQYKQAIDDKKVKNSDTKFNKHVADGCADPLLEVKLQFMLSVAKILQAFLLRFQTDKPMLPFLVSDEVDLVQDLLAKFVNRKTLMRQLLSACVDAKLNAADTCDDVLSDFKNFMRTTHLAVIWKVLMLRMTAFFLSPANVHMLQKGMASSEDVACAITWAGIGQMRILHK